MSGHLHEAVVGLAMEQLAATLPDADAVLRKAWLAHIGPWSVNRATIDEGCAKRLLADVACRWWIDEVDWLARMLLVERAIHADELIRSVKQTCELVGRTKSAAGLKLLSETNCHGLVPGFARG
jgi:hypothetical protein